MGIWPIINLYQLYPKVLGGKPRVLFSPSFYLSLFVTMPPVGCEVLRSACLSVCLFLCPLAHLKNHYHPDRFFSATLFCFFLFLVLCARLSWPPLCRFSGTHKYIISYPMSKFHKIFLYMLFVVMSWSFSYNSAIRYVLPFC